MHRIYQKASSILVSLIIISGVLTLIFLSQDRWLHQEKISLGHYQHYLSGQLRLSKIIQANDECAQQKKPQIQVEIGEVIYRYACEKESIFIQPKPTKDKYIAFTHIQNWLDIENFQSEISYISSLTELPKTSESAPKIVIAKNAIDERLPEHFYGIIITDYYFDITGNKKIYGALYSSFDNLREERNLTFKKSVIDNLDNHYAKWHLLPYSKSLFLNE